MARAWRLVPAVRAPERERFAWFAVLGGPAAYSMKELLGKLRGKAGSPAFLHVPLGLTRSVLGAVEGPLLPVLPFTAGQLATFANDSIATPHPLVSRHLASRRTSPAVAA